MSWTSSAPLLATAIRTLAASPRPICKALTAGKKSTMAAAASRPPEATRPAISTPIAVKWLLSPSSWFSRSAKDSSERTGLTAPSAAAVSMRATPLAKRSGPTTLANTWFATSIPAWPFSSAAVSVMVIPRLAIRPANATGVGSWMIRRSRNEASFLPVGDLARLPTSSSSRLPAAFGHSFALDDARASPPPTLLSFFHSLRRTIRRRRPCWSLSSQERRDTAAGTGAP